MFFFLDIYDRVLDKLPFPIIISVAFLIFCAWLIHTLLNNENYGSTLKSRYFLISLGITIIGLGGYYIYSGFLKNKAEFENNDIGVIVCQFEGDEKNQIQLQLYELIQLACAKDSVTNIKTKKEAYIFQTHQEAIEQAKKKNATAIIWGSKVKDDLIYVKISYLKKNTPAIFPEISFPKIVCVESFFKQLLSLNDLSQKSNLLTQVNTLNARVDSLQRVINILNNENNFGKIVNCKNPSTSTYFKKIYILSVGINNYPSSKLRSAISDADKITAFFNKYGAITTTLHDASRAKIMEAVGDLRTKAGPDDLAIVYLSGIGSKDERDGYFLPGDIEVNNRKGLSSTELSNEFMRFRTKQIIFFVDACYGGSINPFKKGGNGSGPANAGMFASSGENEQAFDYTGNDDTFASYLINGLKGQADLDGSNCVDMQELYNFLSKKYSNLPQKPFMAGSFGKFAFDVHK
jgi:hypothetical protein